ncbi:ATP-binding cassette domain-containing protein [Pontiella sulfatireligans]|uniref:Putative ABC transporter ATP-binding protein YbhF n=1 Tax=Pontiella sulfatireligans TaxID=2750658 RepID=A0A6C2UEG7_9BACT|nr:ATP-binding cassette domain-containing protein [Pontiella sulfatireligans]VGO18570.1 putative ABC transporter ATP-binding protein YbhF [Pontiella sulfatireligans]
MSVLELSGVTKRFAGVPALNDVRLNIRKGTVTGLIGPDGAGKTTLMRLIAGLLVPDSGAISVLGIDAIQDPLKVQQVIGYMPQRFGLYEDLTVQENLDLYADLQGLPDAERQARYAALTHLTGLAPFTQRLAGKLSGGMKQKLGLACVLVRPPQLLLLDEPTVGVDPVSRRELWAIIYRLVREENMTALLSTAYLDEAERCNEVILLHKGELLGQSLPAEFSQKMAGRSFQATLPGMNKRSLQSRLARSSGVIDSTIQRTGVRIVMEADVQPDPAALPAGIRIEPVEPRFEDSFISLLREIDGQPALPEVSLARAVPSGTDDEEVIIVDQVTKRFGSFSAVKDVSFKVKAGEVFGLLGANGAGKSTTFRMLCGLLPATDGHLRVAGLDLGHAPAKARARIGYMAQKFSLYGDLSVLENLRFFSSAYGLRGSDQRAQIDWALQEFELKPYANSTSQKLPLGYKQRLAMAAALMHRPQILFLDEPTSGVDPLARREFWQRIAALAEEGVTILVTTHFMEEAEYCDRLVIMAKGDILAEGTPDELRARVQSDQLPDPTMEDAFVYLIEEHETGRRSDAVPAKS